MRIDMDRFREAFFAEAGEHLETLESSLLRLEAQPGDRELLDSIFRSAHSLKGASSTFGFADVARFTHVLEGLLEQLRGGTLAVTRPLTDLLLRSCDVLGELIEAARTNAEAPARTDLLIEELRSARGSSTCETPASPGQEIHAGSTLRVYQINFSPGPDVFRRGIDPLNLIHDLSQLGVLSAVHADSLQVPPLNELDPETCHLTWSAHIETDRSKAEIEEVFRFIADEGHVNVQQVVVEPADDKEELIPEITSSTTANLPVFERRTDKGSIRVPVDKIDRLVNLVEELVVTQSMLNQAVSQSSLEKQTALRETVAAMDRNLRDLQERVMAIRMVPIGSVTGRFPRLVRELASSLGKRIRFEAHGEETELDKQVIEKIGDPLLHLIRNAADHGIDTPEERLLAGKPVEGVVRLTAAQHGDSVYIEVVDDGRGLNLERIRSRAITRGLIRDDATISDDEIRELIFHPGFSTAEKVTDVSGRGVGMDVVKRNIEALHGSVSISSEFGKGTRIRIKLPLTVAILDGLCLGVGDEVFVIPLLSVVESVRPKTGELRTIFGKGTVLVARGETLPVWHLSRLMDCHSAGMDNALVVIVEGDGKRYGLLVDELLGQSQVVIKTLETNYQKVPGITGATILGDGRVAMILDVHGLQQLVDRETSDSDEPVLVTSA